MSKTESGKQAGMEKIEAILQKAGETLPITYENENTDFRGLLRDAFQRLRIADKKEDKRSELVGHIDQTLQKIVLKHPKLESYRPDLYDAFISEAQNTQTKRFLNTLKPAKQSTRTQQPKPPFKEPAKSQTNGGERETNPQPTAEEQKWKEEQRKFIENIVYRELTRKNREFIMNNGGASDIFRDFRFMFDNLYSFKSKTRELSTYLNDVQKWAKERENRVPLEYKADFIDLNNYFSIIAESVSYASKGDLEKAKKTLHRQFSGDCRYSKEELKKLNAIKAELQLKRERRDKEVEFCTPILKEVSSAFQGISKQIGPKNSREFEDMSNSYRTPIIDQLTEYLGQVKFWTEAKEKEAREQATKSSFRKFGNYISSTAKSVGYFVTGDLRKATVHRTKALQHYHYLTSPHKVTQAIEELKKQTPSWVEKVNRKRQEMKEQQSARSN